MIRPQHRIAHRPALTVQRHTVDPVRLGVGKLGCTSVQGKADRVRDRNTRKELAQFTLVEPIDSAFAILGLLRHRSDPEPALTVSAAVVGPVGGDPGFQFDQGFDLFVFQIEQEQIPLPGDQQHIAADPSGGRDEFGKPPQPRAVIVLRQKGLPQNVEPEQLFADGVPQGAFTQFAAAFVKDHRFAS